MSVRLVQCALGGAAGGGKLGNGGSSSGNGAGGGAASLNGWSGLEEVVKSLPGGGEGFDEWQIKEDLTRRGESPHFGSEPLFEVTRDTDCARCT